MIHIYATALDSAAFMTESFSVLFSNENLFPPVIQSSLPIVLQANSLCKCQNCLIIIVSGISRTVLIIIATFSGELRLVGIIPFFGLWNYFRMFSELLANTPHQSITVVKG